jgi:outer membrane protein assembly factor BamB
MSSTEHFLALLEEREILSARNVANLREQVADSSKRISAESIARRLIKHGKITASQAKRLLAAAEEAAQAEAKAAKKPEQKQQPSQKSEVKEVKKDQDLGFAPIDDEPTAMKRAGKQRGERPAPKPAPEKPAAPAPAPTAVPIAGGSLLEEEMPAVAVPAAAPVLGSPLDGLMADSALAAAATGGPLSAASASSGRRGLFARIFRRKKPQIQTETEKWGSSLMLFGGGALIILLLLGGALLWAMTRSSGDELLAAADADYRSGSYAQAIHKYEAFLEKFSKHNAVSVARVKIGLAQLRQAMGSGNYPNALQTAVDVLGEIAKEKDFKEAHGELASMLPDLADKLAAQARRKPSQDLVDQTRKAVDLTIKYVPKSLRPATKLADIEASLAITVRAIARDSELEKTIASMLASAKESKTEDAYVACRTLLRMYPDLAGNAKLKQAVLEVSKAQQALVKNSTESKPALPAAEQAAETKFIALARNEAKSPLGEAEGRVVVAAVDGAVYGLDAVTGKVLWRRFVGLEANPRGPAFPPTLLGPEPGSDALAVDTTRNELLRLESATGKVVWRAAVGQRFDAYPVVAGDKILVAAADGKLITVSASTGDSPGHIQFPQPLSVSPAIDNRNGLIFQAAAHANLYVLSLADGACRDVYYLGHERGTIVAAPVVVDDFLLLAVNDGARDSALHVFSVQTKKTEKPEPMLKDVQQVRLGGHVLTTPLVDGRRVLVTTSTGGVRVYELSSTDAKAPLRELGETTLEGGENLIRFPLLRGGQFWIADTRLTKYDVQAARGRLMPKWIADQNGAFLQPPTAVGGTIMCVQRRAGLPGAIVSTVSMLDPDLHWRTQIGAPLAGEPVVLPDGKKFTAVTADGTIFRVAPSGEASELINEPIAAADVTLLKSPLRHVVALPGGMLAIAIGRGSDRIGVFDPSAASPLIYWLEAPGELSCGPLAVGGGVLAACRNGLVQLMDPRSGERLADPFQPRLEPGEEIDWLPPAVAGEREVVLADAKGHLYLLGLQDQPKPILGLLAQTTVAKAMISPLAVLGNLAFAADESNLLAGYELPKLARGAELALDGRCVWGPRAYGDKILLAGEDNRLTCIDGQGKRLWQIELKYGPLAGVPLQSGEHFILASRDGTVWRIDAANGKELGKLDVGCPLATGASLFGQDLLIGGHDGAIYQTRQP